jgi:hypothetical protein
MKAIELVEKIEFHERKDSSFRIPLVETYIYVKDFKEFLRLCSGDYWVGGYSNKSNLEYNLRLLKKSRAKRPHFDFLLRQKHVDVYPHENLVVGREGGIHYICQHSFDMFPPEEKNLFYGHTYEQKRKIGVLFALDGEKYDVYAQDILDGFMLHREQINKYRDRFGIWIKIRRNKDSGGEN